MSPSPEHEQLVAALAAGGSVLTPTPTSAPTPEALQEMRAFEATAGFIVSEDTTVSEHVYGGVDCLRLVQSRGTRSTPPRTS